MQMTGNMPCIFRYSMQKWYDYGPLHMGTGPRFSMPRAERQGAQRRGHPEGWRAYGKFHHDLAVLPHWNHGFYREIIPKWPNYSGWWKITIYPYIYIIYVIYLILYIIYMWLDMGNNGLLSIKVDIDRILIIWDVYLFAYLSNLI